MSRAAVAATSGVKFHFIGSTWRHRHIVSTIDHELSELLRYVSKSMLPILVGKRGWRYNVWHQKMF